MISVIIPAYKEPYLNKTIQSIFDNAKGDIEVIVILDGWKLNNIDSRAIVINFEEQQGMRSAINAGIKKSKGEFILKCDAHCIFADGFDEILIRDSKPEWLMVPRRYIINEKKWARTNSYFDYHYLSFPSDKGKYGYSIITLPEMKHKSKRIDDTMMFQGSCWFANKKYFINHIGYLDDKKYSFIGGEQIEIGLKYWLGGGAIKIDKNTWYAHLDKRKDFHLKNNKSSYNLKRSPEVLRNWEVLTEHWLNNKEPNMVHKFSWLIDKFSPCGWFNDWQERFAKIKYKYL